MNFTVFKYWFSIWYILKYCEDEIFHIANLKSSGKPLRLKEIIDAIPDQKGLRTLYSLVIQVTHSFLLKPIYQLKAVSQFARTLSYQDKAGAWDWIVSLWLAVQIFPQESGEAQWISLHKVLEQLKIPKQVNNLGFKYYSCFRSLKWQFWSWPVQKYYWLWN